MYLLKRLLARIGIIQQTGDNKPTSFSGSSAYWEQRYAAGGNSGEGSYGDLAKFKAQVINEFVLEYNIQSVIEFGSGDGNQLSMFNVKRYIGLDVSKTVTDGLKQRYVDDLTKTFHLYHPGLEPAKQSLVAELGLSLDVIYHLVEDKVFEKYIHDLFEASEKYVIIYSSNFESTNFAEHIRHRGFMEYIKMNVSEWEMFNQIQNPFRSASLADFFFYRPVR